MGVTAYGGCSRRCGGEWDSAVGVVVLGIVLSDLGQSIGWLKFLTLCDPGDHFLVLKFGKMLVVLFTPRTGPCNVRFRFVFISYASSSTIQIL